MVDYDLNLITPQIVFEAARAGDAIAQDIYAQAGFCSGVAVANIIIVVGPQ
jgi:predicted NBD/HSP70 family sugar kinase